ncbi:hypothetical protein [Variovorax sp. WS11]|uniref:hypothetical protein n=1 Tax=Variovorax sp. WS11 TaxID=1105204 RepID=UPI0011B255A7|nr:hypothetical protein [Variovorax sp. WS11]NDZ17810.1 hypothetical protein [Variovorax sp. WS11]
MKRFIEGEEGHQVTLLPECLIDHIGEDNPVQVVSEKFQLSGIGVGQRADGRAQRHVVLGAELIASPKFPEAADEIPL